MTDLTRWPALVLTAGLGTRLRPLSSLRAKAALPVAGTPLVRRILAWLAGAGVRRVVLNLHHRPESLTRIVGDGRDLGLEVRYSWEPQVLGSAGGPRHALPLLDADQFLIVNGDTLTDVDLTALTRAHLQRPALVTLAVVKGDTARYGGAVLDREHRVTGFARGVSAAPHASDASGAQMQPGMSVAHFIGVQAVDRETFSSLADNEPAETIRTLYPALIAQQPGVVQAYASDATFLDIGTPADYLATVAAVAGRERRPFDVGVDCRIDPSAVIEGSILWDRVRVGPGARVTDCIVTDDVTIPAGASYTRAVLVQNGGVVQATDLRIA